MLREEPQKIGPYEIREWLGEGGMGEVCRAYDTRLDREVAIKRILGEKTSSPTVHERFLREARSAARLNHPSIVQIYDLMTEGQTDWIVMEFVEGETLSRRLRRGPLDSAVALQLMRDVAEGLAEAHEQGIIHRDIKAENIMITLKGRAKILDFGLARTLADADKALTLTGSVVGTPHAMSPEQASGSKVDARTDIFSFGSLFFQTVTGRHPFRTSKVLETMHRVRSHRQPPAHWLQPDVPEVISELIDELLEKDPDNRPASSVALARRLAQLASTPFSSLSKDSAPLAEREPEPPLEPRTLATWVDDEIGPHSATTLVSLAETPETTELTALHDLEDHGVDEALKAGGGALLVGRDEELALVVRRWQRVCSGSGQVVLVSGPAGIGKSRLIAAVLGREELYGAVPLLGQCQRHEQNLPFAPVIRLLRHVVRSRSEDGRFDQAELERFLGAHDLPLGVVVPLFAELFSVPMDDSYTLPGLSPEGLRRQTLEAVLALMVAMAERNPVVLLFEDVHWMDPSSLELLDLLVRQGPAVPLLTLLTTRSSSLGRWSGAAHLTLLTLGPLGREETARLVRGLAGERDLPAEVAAELVAKSDGIPLFAEELTRGLLESGVLVDQGGRYALAGSVSSLGIPETLEDSLQGRLERLGPTKAVAQEASVIGRTFSERLLAAVSSFGAEDLGRHLAKLVDTEILYRRGLGERRGYVFQHALVQDAAYQSLERSHRRRLHGQLVGALRSAFRRDVDERPELLAHHQMAAGNLAEAVPLWLDAGKRACERSANVEAVHHLRRGLEAVAQLPAEPSRDRLELKLTIQLGPALIATRGVSADEVAEAYSRARDLCATAGTAEAHQQALWGLFTSHLSRAEFELAKADVEEVLVLAKKTGDELLLAEAHHSLGACLTFCGDFETAHRLLLLAAEAEPKGSTHYALGHDPWVANYATLGLLAWLQGRHEESVERAQAALHRARRLKHPFTECFALYFAAWIHQLRGEPEPTKELAEELLRIAREQSFPWLVGKGELFLGWALASAGEGDDGLDLLRATLGIARSLGIRFLQPHALAIHGEICLKRGLLDEAREVLTEAAEILKETGEGLYEAEVERLRGELRAVEGDRQGAEEALRRALVVARSQKASSLEQAAAASLARHHLAE